MESGIGYADLQMVDGSLTSASTFKSRTISSPGFSSRTDYCATSMDVSVVPCRLSGIFFIMEAAETIKVYYHQVDSGGSKSY